MIEIQGYRVEWEDSGPEMYPAEDYRCRPPQFGDQVMALVASVDAYAEIDALRARLSELEAEKAELVKDRERLDWLASQKYPEIRQRDLCWISCDSHAEYHGETLRQAIDAAREGE